MGAAVKLDKMLGEAQKASERVMLSREDARKAVDAIRKLEARLREAIAGDTLRGMATLSEGIERGYMMDGTEVHEVRSALQGARVRGTTHGIDSWLRPDGKPTLVISRDGELLMASREPNAWYARRVRDEELQAQDLEPIVRAVHLVLQRHVARSARTAESYERACALSERLAATVGWF